MMIICGMEPWKMDLPCGLCGANKYCVQHVINNTPNVICEHYDIVKEFIKKEYSGQKESDNIDER